MKPLAVTLAAGLATLGPLAADQLTLDNGDSLSGSVLEIGEGGKISFESPNAEEPFVFRGNAVSSIHFDYSPPKKVPQSERIRLRNGDILPGELLSLDEDALQLRTWASGDLTIPRSAIAAVNFGVTPHDLIFAGPGKESDWKENENWKFEANGMTSSSRGTIARREVLPEQFILRFRLTWLDNPNFRFYFCDDLLERSGEADRYYFEVNSAGFQLKRQAADSKRRWYPLYSSQRRPDSFAEDEVDVELRVDRQRRLIYIYINGESEGRHHDPIEGLPEGSGIMLESLAGGEMKNIVSAIEIYEWDAVSQIHRTEGHKNTDSDAIVTSESERYEGTAQGLEGGGENRAILIKSPHSDDPVRIPFDALSVLYFRKPAKEEPYPSEFLLDLAGKGRLSANSLLLAPDELRMDHPLLGDLVVRKDALKSLKSTAQSSTDPTP
jgi:hypothetical protein